MRFIIILFILPFLLVPAFAAAEGRLVSCEYSITGGMENEHTVYAIKQQEAYGDVRLMVEEGAQSQAKILPRSAMEEFAALAATWDPAGWADLPEREEYALDAPDRRLTLRYDDGTEYSLFNDRQISSMAFWEAEMFMASYLAADAQTFDMSFSSFEGGGPEYHAVLSDPAKVWVETRRQYDAPYETLPPGAGYTIIMTFHGRIPGRTELIIEMSGPLTPVEDIPPTVHVLEVDNSFNVRLIEKQAET